VAKPIPVPPLIAGPYRTPALRIGGWATCLVRGEVRIDGLTDAPIPWPYTHASGRYASLIVCDDLARALRVEATAAIAHHWGVSRYYVSRLRRALGLTAGPGRNYTEGARQYLDARRP
jgi:hypothetical protein